MLQKLNSTSAYKKVNLFGYICTEMETANIIHCIFKFQSSGPQELMQILQFCIIGVSGSYGFVIIDSAESALT